MARLKFYRTKPTGCTERMVVETSQYEIEEYATGRVDVTYTLMPNDRRTVEVSNRQHFNSYPRCYIEAESTGQTIDQIVAKDQLTVPAEEVQIA
ncbi:hypothetical protein GY26_16215 [Gammaproteobacteria bacterium MFB021]|nr:hypothetical protein GY26_16215 [Gammaproteobacteria bacterium MFB021]